MPRPRLTQEEYLKLRGAVDDGIDLPLIVDSIEENECNVLPIADEPLGIISDLHVPYHSVEAVQKALMELKKKKVRQVLINGDFLNFNQISSFTRLTTDLSLAKEIELGAKMFAQIQDYIGGPVFFRAGNHDERLDKYIANNAPELLGSPDLALSQLLGISESHVFIGVGPILHAGYAIYHGHEIRLSGGVSPARTSYLRTGMNTIASHVHKTDDYRKVLADGRQVRTATIGCLCQKNPRYFPTNDWNWGYAILTPNGDLLNETIG